MATRKPRRFGEGGVTDAELAVANASDDPIASLNAQKGWTGTEDSAAPAAEPAKKQSFKEAFAEARKGGGKTFEWNGKKYTTEMAGEKPAASMRSAAPAKVTDTGDETARMAARAPAKKAAYETPYDRMNRQNREASAARSSAKDAERETLRKNIREGSSGKVNPKTLLPEYKKGGSVKGWGIARGARKAKIV